MMENNRELESDESPAISDAAFAMGGYLQLPGSSLNRFTWQPGQANISGLTPRLCSDLKRLQITNRLSH